MEQAVGLKLKGGVRTGVKQSELALSLCFFVVAGHSFQIARSTTATKRCQDGRRYILVHFLFCMFLKTLCHESCKAKKQTKYNFYPIYIRKLKK